MQKANFSRWLAILALGVVLGGCTRQVATSRQHEALLRAEASRFEATVDADTAQLRRQAHPALVYTHSNGLVESRKEHLQNVGGGRIDYQGFEKLGPDTVLVEGKIARINSRVRVQGLYEGSPFTVLLWYRSRYQKQRGRWKLAAWTSTKVEE